MSELFIYITRFTVEEASVSSVLPVEEQSRKYTYSSRYQHLLISYYNRRPKYHQSFIYTERRPELYVSTQTQDSSSAQNRQVIEILKCFTEARLCCEATLHCRKPTGLSRSVASLFLIFYILLRFPLL